MFETGYKPLEWEEAIKALREFGNLIMGDFLDSKLLSLREEPVHLAVPFVNI